MPTDDLAEHRALIEACLRHRVSFRWDGPGTLLIPSQSIGAILADVTAQGFPVLGVEGFEVDTAIHPRLDLIIDNTGGHGYRDPATEPASWGDNVWVDVTLGLNLG